MSSNYIPSTKEAKISEKRKLTKIIVLAIQVYHIVLIHVELMLRIHFTELRPDPFPGNNSSGPCLEPNNYSYILLKVILNSKVKQIICLQYLLALI